MIGYIIYFFLATWPLYAVAYYARFFVFDLGHGIPAIDIMRSYAAIILIIIIFYGLIVKRKIKIDAIIITVTMCTFYFLFHIFLKGAGRGIPSAVSDVLQIYVIPLVIYFALVNSQDLLNKKALIYATMFAGIFISGTGILEFIAGHNLVGPENLTSDTVSRIFRTNGPFWDVIGYAAICISFVPLSYYVMKTRIINRTIPALCMLLCTIGAIVSYARIIWIVLLLIYMIVLYGNGIIRKLIMLYGIILIILLLYSTSDMIAQTAVYKRRISDTRDITGRYNQYVDALQLFIGKPIVGIGYENYLKTHPLQLHNSYLRIMVEFGFLGITFYLLFIISVLFSKIRDYLRATNGSGLKAKLSLITLVLFAPNTVDLFSNSYFILTVMIVTAIINIINIRETKVAFET